MAAARKKGRAHHRRHNRKGEANAGTWFGLYSNEQASSLRRLHATRSTADLLYPRHRSLPSHPRPKGTRRRMSAVQRTLQGRGNRSRAATDWLHPDGDSGGEKEDSDRIEKMLSILDDAATGESVMSDDGADLASPAALEKTAWLLEIVDEAAASPPPSNAGTAPPPEEAKQTAAASEGTPPWSESCSDSRFARLRENAQGARGRASASSITKSTEYRNALPIAPLRP